MATSDPRYRGEAEVALFAVALREEMTRNARKGHWTETEIEDPFDGKTPRDDLDYLGDLIYHMFKLARAVANHDGPGSIREYAADVGNCAWFIADAHDALQSNSADAAIEHALQEYDGTGPNQEFYQLLKDEAQRIAERLLDPKLQYRLTKGGELL